MVIRGLAVSYTHLDVYKRQLDPKTALKVLTLSAKLVEENHLTTMMITHNMKDAIKYGHRLIMMYEGHIIYDAVSYTHLCRCSAGYHSFSAGQRDHFAGRDPAP